MQMDQSNESGYQGEITTVIALKQQYSEESDCNNERSWRSFFILF